MLSWRAPGWPARRIVADVLPTEILQWIAAQRLSLSLYDVGDSALLSVVMAVLSRDGGEVTIGASSGNEVPRAALKATFEAIMLRATAAHLDSITGDLSEGAISDSGDHVVWAYRNGDKVLRWYEGQSATRAPAPRASDVVEACSRVFGHEPIVVDLTHLDLERDGLFVVRVLQAGSFRKEYRHDARYRGGARLASLGLRPEALNPLPHPIG